MKKRSLLFLSIFSLFAILFSSCAKREILFSLPADEGLTVTLSGSDGRASRVSVSNADGEFWSEKISVKKDISTFGQDRQLKIADFNFDGRDDIAVALSADGEVVSYAVFLAESDRNGYSKSEALSSLANLAVADAEEHFLFSFDRTVTTGRGEEARNITVTTDTAIKYRWEDDSPVPEIRVSLVSYSDTGMHCYSVSLYDTENGSWDSYEDVWLTAEEYAVADFSFLYYFR